MQKIPCVAYNCTFYPYRDRDGNLFCGDLLGNPNTTGCFWGVDIGEGEGFFPWGSTFTGDGSGTWGGYVSYEAPYENDTTCYHPAPLNPDSLNYCGTGEYFDRGYGGWISDWDCMPVFECTPEYIYSWAFIITLSCLCVTSAGLHVWSFASLACVD